jgi:hypothetical protein
MIDNMFKQNQTLVAELTKLKFTKNSVKNSHNTTNSNNVTNNIVMIDFGKEDLQIIDKSEFCVA